MAFTYSFSFLEPVCCSMSISNCCFLTCILISQEAGQVVWYSHLFQIFPQFIGLKLNIQKTNIIASGPITSCEIYGKTVERVSDFILGAPKSLQMVTAAMKLKGAYFLEGKL